ncbi:hypothetical protein AB0M39_27725 [Streptomyces sp. NPDC051907]|uniref:hypothetical protein n=1 Tax=Streptomyces sp. NPDC051907 TaxID=3155284 RepID=UPI00341422FD
MRRVLSTVSAVMIVLVAVLTPLSALAAWVNLELGDTDSYVTAMAPLASDPAVQNAVAANITDEVMREIDVGPFQDSVQSLVHDAVLSFTGTDSFKTAWNTVNRAAHTVVEQSLTEDSGNTVAIDLAPVVEQVKQQLNDDGVPFADQIPVQGAQITILESDRLSTARDVFHTLKNAGLWLPAATLLLALGAVLMPPRRGLAVLGLGVAFAVGGLLLRILVATSRDPALEALPPDVDRPAAGAVYDALTATLVTTSWVLMGGGAAIALTAWAMGRRSASRGHPEPPPAPTAEAT